MSEACDDAGDYDEDDEDDDETSEPKCKPALTNKAVTTSLSAQKHFVNFISISVSDIVPVKVPTLFQTTCERECLSFASPPPPFFLSLLFYYYYYCQSPGLLCMQLMCPSCEWLFISHIGYHA